MKTMRISISGKVQGVYFRQTTRYRCLEWNITGQVRNLPNGTVEVIATGNPDQLKKLSDWCQTGPEKAIVQSVKTEELNLRLFESFLIIR